jgi:NAD(P)-dependent dehydrogenase (short-subunit alcohol dehydrogenase family)
MSRENGNVIVTGAGSGIGRAICKLASEAGMEVFGIDRDERGLGQTVELTGAGSAVCDVADEASLVRAIDQAQVYFGTAPQSLIAAAGVYRISPAQDISGSAFTDLLNINVVGAFVAAREVATRATNGGSIVLIASMAYEGGDTNEPAAHYSASKGAIVSLTRQLAVEWAARGIRVNAVSPGVIDTPMLRLIDDPAKAAEYLETGVPMRRFGTAEEVAKACLFLASADASYITGVILPVDGGATIT